MYWFKFSVFSVFLWFSRISSKGHHFSDEGEARSECCGLAGGGRDGGARASCRSCRSSHCACDQHSDQALRLSLWSVSVHTFGQQQQQQYGERHQQQQQCVVRFSGAVTRGGGAGARTEPSVAERTAAEQRSVLHVRLRSFRRHRGRAGQGSLENWSRCVCGERRSHSDSKRRTAQRRSRKARRQFCRIAKDIKKFWIW